MNLPKSYSPEQTEEKMYRLWEKSGLFNPDKLPGKRKKSYAIAIPPPNVTGELHMGHALNAVIQDILIRKKKMEGFKTLWIPGTDHAGIATQNAVEKNLKKEGKTRFDLGREEFLQRVWQWKEKYGGIILDQFKKIGASCDWSRTAFTMDNDYAEAVNEAFIRYYEKGLIHKGKRVVNWCPRCQTSLSELELEYEQEQGNLWYIKYPLTDKIDEFVTVATTRPETMLGDAALAVNPRDERYKKLIGKKVVLPLVEKEIPIVADKTVDSNFGTGALKVTPAHDSLDAEIGQRHNLENLQVIDQKGKMNENSPPPYRGLSLKEARGKIVKDLEEKNLLEKTEDYSHQIPKCYRCGATVESIPSEQWFLKMKDLAENAKKAVKSKKVSFHPKRWEKVYFDWLKNIKDWCISRQLWWGHRLPVWQCQKTSEYFASKKEPKKCPLCKKCKPKQSTDVLDTWFSSALWPFATLGWPKKTKDMEKFYPTDVLSTARDIINLWVARMIFSGIEFTGKPPFHTVLIHPTVLTKEGKRMSKSLGTGIDPINLIKNYGADATRFGIAYQLMKGQDMKFTEDNIIMGKKFCNKIWNASRFALMQLGDEKMEARKINSEITRKLHETAKEVDRDLEKYNFGKAAHKLYDFFWHDFCDKCIEESKGKKDKKTKTTLLYVLLTSLKLMHPFIPFVTEEIYQTLPLKNKKKSLSVEDWPK